jgi:hypothetical protein
MIRTAIGVLLLVPLRSASAAPNNEEIQALREQLAVQNARMEAMQARLEALEKLVSGLALPAHPGNDPPEAPLEGRSADDAPNPRVRWRVSGFADVTGVLRSTFTGAGISTPFGSIPPEWGP